MKYAEITVDVAAADAERVVEELVGDGLAVEERDGTTLLKPAPGRAEIVVYAAAEDAADSAATVEEALRRSGVVAEVRRADKDEENWRDAWKQYFQPRSVGPFAIVPSWHIGYLPRPGETVITLDPGRAFGTGGHASTRLCLQALGHVAPASRILDVGCGSGILGIGAALRWPEARVTAVDVDPEAVGVTVENARENGVEPRIEASTARLDRLGVFDLALANIQADVLAEIAPALSARVRPGGALILGGILAELAPSVETAYAACGLHRRGDGLLLEDGWCALILDNDNQPRG